MSKSDSLRTYHIMPHGDLNHTLRLPIGEIDDILPSIFFAKLDSKAQVAEMRDNVDITGTRVDNFPYVAELVEDFLAMYKYADLTVKDRVDKESGRNDVGLSLIDVVRMRLLKTLMHGKTVQGRPTSERMAFSPHLEHFRCYPGNFELSTVD